MSDIGGLQGVHGSWSRRSCSPGNSPLLLIETSITTNLQGIERFVKKVETSRIILVLQSWVIVSEKSQDAWLLERRNSIGAQVSNQLKICFCEMYDQGGRRDSLRLLITGGVALFCRNTQVSLEFEWYHRHGLVHGKM